MNIELEVRFKMRRGDFPKADIISLPYSMANQFIEMDDWQNKLKHLIAARGKNGQIYLLGNQWDEVIANMDLSTTLKRCVLDHSVMKSYSAIQSKHLVFVRSDVFLWPQLKPEILLSSWLNQAWNDYYLVEPGAQGEITINHLENRSFQPFPQLFHFNIPVFQCAKSISLSEERIQVSGIQKDPGITSSHSSSNIPTEVPTNAVNDFSSGSNSVTKEPFTISNASNGEVDAIWPVTMIDLNDTGTKEPLSDLTLASVENSNGAWNQEMRSLLAGKSKDWFHLFLKYQLIAKKPAEAEICLTNAVWLNQDLLKIINKNERLVSYINKHCHRFKRALNSESLLLDDITIKLRWLQIDKQARERGDYLWAVEQSEQIVSQLRNGCIRVGSELPDFTTEVEQSISQHSLFTISEVQQLDKLKSGIQLLDRRLLKLSQEPCKQFPSQSWPKTIEGNGFIPPLFGLNRLRHQWMNSRPNLLPSYIDCLINHIAPEISSIEAYKDLGDIMAECELVLLPLSNHSGYKKGPYSLLIKKMKKAMPQIRSIVFRMTGYILLSMLERKTGLVSIKRSSARLLEQVETLLYQCNPIETMEILCRVIPWFKILNAKTRISIGLQIIESKKLEFNCISLPYITSYLLDKLVELLSDINTVTTTGFLEYLQNRETLLIRNRINRDLVDIALLDPTQRNCSHMAKSISMEAEYG